MVFLIVDDSRTVRRVLQNIILQYFEEKKWIKPTIYEAEDGLVAMEYMDVQQIDFIFLDYNMPNMNGEEVVEAVRINKKWNKSKIVMATTEGSKESVLKMMKKGVNGYVVKPFIKESINKTLSNIIRQQVKCSV